MIHSLYIKNIALIQELTITLSKGLNILSGETGAGKSIIIDSLNFVLGDRADRSLIRFGEDHAVVEVVFDCQNKLTDATLLELGIEVDDFIIITRKMTENRSECRVNGRIVTVNMLRMLVGLLIDIHSQNEHHSLLKSSVQMELLDDFSPDTISIKQKYREFLEQFHALHKQLEQYSTSEDRARLIELLSYQIEEIERAMFSQNEEEELYAQRKKYYNSQKIVTSLLQAVEVLSGGQTTSGIIDAVNTAIFALSSIAVYDESLRPLIERLESVSIEADDIVQSLNDMLDFDGAGQINIEQIESRLEEIRLIKKKYGKTFEEIQEFLTQSKSRLRTLENAEEDMQDINNRLQKASNQLIKYAKLLHHERQNSSQLFCAEIVKHLGDLGMKNTVFEIALDFPNNDEEILNRLTQNGVDSVEYLLSPNLGEPIKPLAKIASGGEMSRFMLALKNVIADIDNIGTLVFDEIDSGISGKIAKEVAKKLYNIAGNRQVIAITHLPQLAAMADSHYLIAKEVVEEKTVTSLQLLDEQSTYAELMRLAGSAEKSEIGLSHAKELKNWANDYKQSV